MSEKKKRINGKSKGNGFEREVSKKLSLHLTNGNEEMAIWRSSSSGATSTVGFKKKKTSLGLQTQSGDLIQVIPKGSYHLLDAFFDTYMIEVKFLKSLDLSPNYSSQFKKIFTQLLREKEQSGKLIFFVLKRNGRDILILTDSVLYNCKSVGSLVYQNVTFDIYFFDDFVKEKNLENSEKI